MSEQEFAQKWPGAVKWNGTTSAFFFGKEWKRLDPAATTEDAFLPIPGSGQEFGYFWFQADKLIALEVTRFDPSSDANLTSEIIRKLRSLASDGSSCSLQAHNVSDTGGDNQAQQIHLICERHEVIISRELETFDKRKLLGYSLSERLVDGAARVVALPSRQN